MVGSIVDIRLRLLETLYDLPCLLTVVPESGMYRFLRKEGTVDLDDRKSVKGLHDRLIGDLHGLLDGFAFYHLCGHAAASYGRTTAERLELAVPDYPVI